MGNVTDIADDHIVSQVAANNSAVVKTDRQTYIMVLQRYGFQFPDPDQPIELAILNQLRIESI